MPYQPRSRIECLSNVMFFEHQFIVRNQPPIARIDQMVQHLLLGTSRNTSEAGELFVAKSSKPFGNIGGSRSSCITQLVEKPKVTLDGGAFK